MSVEQQADLYTRVIRFAEVNKELREPDDKSYAAFLEYIDAEHRPRRVPSVRTSADAMARRENHGTTAEFTIKLKVFNTYRVEKTIKILWKKVKVSFSFRVPYFPRLDGAYAQ